MAKEDEEGKGGSEKEGGSKKGGTGRLIFSQGRSGKDQSPRPHSIKNPPPPQDFGGGEMEEEEEVGGQEDYAFV